MIKQEAKSSVAELVAVAFNIVAAELIDHNDDNELWMAIVGGRNRRFRNCKESCDVSHEVQDTAGRPREGSHRERSLHRGGEFAKAGIKAQEAKLRRRQPGSNLERSTPMHWFSLRSLADIGGNQNRQRFIALRSAFGDHSQHNGSPDS